MLGRGGNNEGRCRFADRKKGKKRVSLLSQRKIVVTQAGRGEKFIFDGKENSQGLWRRGREDGKAEQPKGHISIYTEETSRKRIPAERGLLQEKLHLYFRIKKGL